MSACHVERLPLSIGALIVAAPQVNVALPSLQVSHRVCLLAPLFRRNDAMAGRSAL